MNIHRQGFHSRSALAEDPGSGTTPKHINLALQGRGAHGAFTWGVLDRLLEDPRIAFEGISATGADAANAAVLAYGFTVGGREGAKKALANFWRRVAHAAPFSPLHRSLPSRLGADRAAEGLPMHFDVSSQLPSPHPFNPHDHERLRKVLDQTIEFEPIRRGSAIKLFLSTTNVRTGKVQILRDSELTTECILVAACQPFLFKAVEVEGKCYWDRGYMERLALFPLIHGCDCRDILVVHINPIERANLPTTACDIMDWDNDTGFNSPSRGGEGRTVASAPRRIDHRPPDADEMHPVLIHAIATGNVLQGFGVASKLNTDWEFLIYLRDFGRARADAWLRTHLGGIGAESTAEILDSFL
jgi:NTE family protein